MEALEDQGEVFDTLMGLRDARRVENTKLMGLNDLDTQAEEEIENNKKHEDILAVFLRITFSAVRTTLMHSLCSSEVLAVFVLVLD
ncbi:hypothetical protein Tco_1107717 [Tanacetum coccineum]